MLITAGTQDTRVEWWGPVKFAWRLRAHQEGAAPILLSWGRDGHFCVTPNQVALEHTFLLQHLAPFLPPASADAAGGGAAATAA